MSGALLTETAVRGLSIVLGTYNRWLWLKRCMQSIGKYMIASDGARGMPYEVIVVDGGSTDLTLENLRTSDAVVIEQGELLGAVKAFNAGFAVAKYAYVANLNDDAALTDRSLLNACSLLDAAPVVGQVAIPFGHPFYAAKLDKTLPLQGKNWLYANFGVTRKDLGDRLGWWGTDYHTYAGDPELSMKIWNAGHQVAPLGVGRIDHSAVRDKLRKPNTDSPQFYKKWAEWEGPGDERPQFCGG